METIEKHFSLDTNHEIIENVSEKILDTAGQMFMYLTFNLDRYIRSTTAFIRFHEKKSLSTFFLSLNRMLIKEWNPLGPYETFSPTQYFKILGKEMKLKFQEIGKYLGQCAENCSLPAPSCLLEDEKIQRLINHPVHFDDDLGNRSPTAFIPYCWIGQELDFDKDNICKSFKPVLRNDQVCYEVDPVLMKTPYSNKKIKGVFFAINENQDKGFTHKNNDAGSKIFLDVFGKRKFNKIS